MHPIDNYFIRHHAHIFNINAERKFIDVVIKLINIEEVQESVKENEKQNKSNKCRTVTY